MSSSSHAATFILPERVLVHPLVLLSVVDHYKRASLAPGKRVVGVLLGYWTGRILNVTNSYAVLFEENEQDPTVWYIDHNYHENMNELYKKVNAKEKPVGWYHSGPKLRPSDLTINNLFTKYCHNPVLVIVDPLYADGLPIQAYVAQEEVREEGLGHQQQNGSSNNAARVAKHSFTNLPCGIEAEEAEEVGVEHLLRDLKDGSVSHLSDALHTKTASLVALDRQLGQLEDYLDNVVAGKLPANQRIIAGCQEIFNQLPDVHGRDAQRALALANNDQMAMIYVGQLARAVIALHELIANKKAAASLAAAVN